MFVPVWLVLPRRDAANLGVFDLGHFDLISDGAVQIRVTAPRFQKKKTLFFLSKR